MTSLTTFRAGSETISSDPSERTDGDVTTWVFDPATGLELSKTYADNTSVVKTYDAFNRLATETDARGNVKTHAYEHARGLHLGTTYSVVEGTAATTARSYAYNHLGQLTQVVDDAGTRTIAYNAYGEQESDSLNAGTHTHLITEQRDSYGRSIGYTYARSGAQQHRVTTGYGADGRIATAGFLHGNSEKQFAYGYLSGSNLLQTLTMPNNMTLTQSYEAQRDLLTGMSYKRGNTPVAERSYSYDTLGRPLTRSTIRSGQPTRSDSFSHNERSELSAATLGSDSYSYAYDNIGNRTNATEGGTITAYASNNLNQYTAVGEFTPTFDADGNQTLVKTSTGIWAVQYNAENRPVSFTNSASNTVVECTYDSMGRRATKKVITNGSVTSYLRFIYRGYLQIAAIDAISGTFQWFLVWDPAQSIATRPLAIRKDATWYTYGWDLSENICEIFGQHGYIRTTYTYLPYGQVMSNGDTEQPIQWSSEYYDSELDLMYYNYRHYNPYGGRWINRDAIHEKGYFNSYRYSNDGYSIDNLGLFCSKYTGPHNELSDIRSFELTFKHADMEEMDITIQDPSSIIKGKIESYLEDEIDEAFDNQFPEIKELRKLTSNAMELYNTLKQKVFFLVRWTSSIGTLYNEVQVKVSALRCCCTEVKRKNKRGKLKKRTCCEAKPVEGIGSANIFLDVRGAIVGGILHPEKISKMVINETVSKTFLAMKEAANNLKYGTECSNEIE